MRHALLPAALLLLPLTAQARPDCHTAEQRNRVAFANAGESDRPPSVGYVDSALYPIRVHYRRAGDEARAINVILPSAENAWKVEVEEMGWPSPATDAGLGGDDRFDYYLTNEETYGGAWTWGPPEDVVSDDGWFSIAAFVALDDTQISNADMDDFVAHEFNHALQYTIDGIEATSFVWESTAEAMEELVIPDTDLYMLDIPYFQKLPFGSLLFSGYDEEITAYDRYSLYEYGGSIAGLYLEEAYGQRDGTTLLQLWLNLAQGGRAQEPDYIDSLGMIGGDLAPTYEDVYLGLAEWRMFVHTDDDGAHFEEGAAWGAASMVATEGSLALSSISGTSVSPEDAPYDLGTSYWVIDVDDAEEGSLKLRVEGAAGLQWGIVAAAWQEAGPATVLRQRAGADEVVEATLDLTGATRVMVGVANLGAPDLNAEGKHDRADFSLSFERILDTEEDSDPTAGEDSSSGDKEEPAACGCSSSQPSGLAGLGLLGILGLLLRRRR